MSLMNALKGAANGVSRVRENRSRNQASASADPSHMHCTNCGFVGKTKTTTPGSIWIELILWLCFIIPGLIYSAWRHNKRHESCGKCGSSSIIPSDSPFAMRGASQ